MWRLLPYSVPTPGTTLPALFFWVIVLHYLSFQGNKPIEENSRLNENLLVKWIKKLKTIREKAFLILKLLKCSHLSLSLLFFVVYVLASLAFYIILKIILMDAYLEGGWDETVVTYAMKSSHISNMCGIPLCYQFFLMIYFLKIFIHWFLNILDCCLRMEK